MERKPKILVVGDVILDRYLHGTIKRVNPEAPGVVFKAERTEDRLGGAGAVAYLCAGLGCEVTLAGNRGCDWYSEQIADLLRESEIANHLAWGNRTTVKQRCVADGRTLPDRIDWDCISSVSEDEWRRHLNCYDSDQFDCVLVADYGKGAAFHVMNPLREKFPDTRIIVDPHPLRNWRAYRDADIIKCNRNEAEEDYRQSAENVICTLDGEGMMLDGELIPTVRREVLDCTGAGDTVLAVLGWCIARGVELREACRLANIAAGLQVQRLGVQQIMPWEIEGGKLCDPVQFAKHSRSQGKTVAAANGVFDLLHAGHIATLRYARAQADCLIVLANSDESARRLKGPGRPVLKASERLDMLAALECVNCAAVFEETTPEELLSQILPDVLVKGAEYECQAVPGQQFAGRVAFAPEIPGLSTTAILERVGVG